MGNDEQYKCLCCNPFHRGHRNIGIFQLVCGIFLVFFQIAATIGGAYAYKLSAGIWAGLFLIATGILAITYQDKKKAALYFAYAVLAHISAMACVIVFGASVAGTHEDWTTMVCDYRYYRWRYRTTECYRRDFKLSMHVFLITLGLTGIILSIISATIIWSQICCKAKEVVMEKKLSIDRWEKMNPNESVETDV